MDTINIFDKNFMPYSDSSTLGKAPREFEYVKGKTNFDGITIFTDHMFGLASNVRSKFKIAWQVESPVHSQRQFYPMVKNYSHLFDMIFTYDENLIAKDPHLFKRCNFGGTTVIEPDMNLFAKHKSVAIVHSGKRDTPNHIMREKVAKGGKVDAFGRMTGKPFDNIADILVPYNFAVIIENMNCDNYFSEKLTDCIACGCIPVYNGCTNIGNYFDTDGMIRFDTLEELDTILPTLTDEKFQSMINPHTKNFKTVVDEYYTNEDWLYLNYMKGLISE